MNIGEMIKRVKRQFGDESGVQITDEDVIRWVNDAQRDLAIHNDLLQTVATTTTVARQDQYFLPPDILTLRSVRIDGAKLDFIPVDQAAITAPDDASQPVGVPTHFSRWADKLNLYPVPATPASLQVYYTRVPLTIEYNVESPDLNQIPELPLEYHTRIIEYCMRMAYEFDENWDAAQIKDRQFAAGVLDLKGRSEASDSGFYPSITSVSEYY